MKRKVLSAALAVVMVASLLTGCGGKNKKEKQEQVSVDRTYSKEAVESSILVQKIEGLSDEFIRGVDISSLLVEEASGVKFYDFDGNEADIFKVLSDAGVNWVRVRVWNDPYDANGNGYGGGNCNVQTAAEIGARAAKYGMKLLVDFHYSDFWADPGKQMVPKAWKGMSLEEKQTALTDYTIASLKTIAEAGADIGMVQVGNETNGGIAGESTWGNTVTLIKTGCAAVRTYANEAGKDILVAVHFTNVTDANGIKKVAAKFLTEEVDYDVFGLSYYTYWHGTFENLAGVMDTLTGYYNKKVCIMETAYPYTSEDQDGNGNNVTGESPCAAYSASVQGQATCVRDVMAAVAAYGEKGLGCFYWEPAWIPVNEYHETWDNAAEIWEKNSAIWEKYGSGWASSYAADYDPKDAGVYYGGSSWDNQAMFDATGHPLESLNIFKYVSCGTICEVTIDHVSDMILDVNVGSEFTLPATVPVVYNDPTVTDEAPVTWNEEELAAVDVNTMAEYPVTGTLENGMTLTCRVKVAYLNQLTNGSFEDSDTSMWSISYNGRDGQADFQQKADDAYTGEMSLHFWDSEAVSFEATQTLTGLEPGTYYFSAYGQGGDIKDGATMYMFVTVDGETHTQEFALDGWVNWVKVEIPDLTLTGDTITVGVHVECGAGGWGTFDDFYLCKLN